MADFRAQIADSSIPYPQRHLLALEIEGDAGALEETLADADLRELEAIHSTRLSRLLAALGARKREIETLIAFTPPSFAAVYFFKEEKMIEFIRDGGAGMYALLAIGTFLLLKEALNVFRLLVIKAHSKENLRLDTPSVLLGCLALMFFGIGLTALGIYISANAVFEAKLPYDILMLGVKESLAPLILSSTLSAVIVLAHYSTRHILRIWHAPIAES